MPPSDVKRPAIKKQMHCVNFFGTNDFAWIEEFNVKAGVVLVLLFKKYTSKEINPYFYF